MWVLVVVGLVSSEKKMSLFSIHGPNSYYCGSRTIRWDAHAHESQATSFLS